MQIIVEVPAQFDEYDQRAAQRAAQRAYNRNMERKKKIIDIIWELLLPDADRQHPQGWKQHLVGAE